MDDRSHSGKKHEADLPDPPAAQSPQSSGVVASTRVGFVEAGTSYYREGADAIKVDLHQTSEDALCPSLEERNGDIDRQAPASCDSDVAGVEDEETWKRVREGFRDYALGSITASGASSYKAGATDKFVSCFEPIIEHIAECRKTRAYRSDDADRAMNEIERVVIASSIPPTLPWMPSDLFGNEEFRSAMTDAIRRRFRHKRKRRVMEVRLPPISPLAETPSGVFAASSKVQEMAKEHPELSGPVSLVAHIQKAQAEAEVAFRTRVLTEDWSSWSGLHPWDDKPELEKTDCPWWTAGAEYVFHLVSTWRKHHPAKPEETAQLLTHQLKKIAEWVYRSKVRFHDMIYAKNPKIEDLVGETQVIRFSSFSLLFVMSKFAAQDLSEWEKRTAQLTGAMTDLEVKGAKQPSSYAIGDAEPSKAIVPEGGIGKTVHVGVNQNDAGAPFGSPSGPFEATRTGQANRTIRRHRQQAEGDCYFPAGVARRCLQVPGRSSSARPSRTVQNSSWVACWFQKGPSSRKSVAVEVVVATGATCLFARAKVTTVITLGNYFFEPQAIVHQALVDPLQTPRESRLANFHVFGQNPIRSCAISNSPRPRGYRGESQDRSLEIWFSLAQTSPTCWANPATTSKCEISMAATVG